MDRNRCFDTVRDALLGQAVGDAFGVPLEFLSREEVRALSLKKMAGCDSEEVIASRWGPLIPKGSWSDDTSMTLASMSSFILNGGHIDWEDQMKQFSRWWNENEYCCLDYPFGLGTNISAAMLRFRMGFPALECGGTGLMDNGNGALMRILPFAMYCIMHELDTDKTAQIISNASAITHRHPISRMSCLIWTEFLRALADGSAISRAVREISSLPYGKWFPEEALKAHAIIVNGNIPNLREEAIGETGYVVDTLYSALYALLNAGSYEESILLAASLGYDTDTVCAVTGMAAGIIYGAKAIPRRWLADLRKKETLELTAAQFAQKIWKSRGDDE